MDERKTSYTQIMKYSEIIKICRCLQILDEICKTQIADSWSNCSFHGDSFFYILHLFALLLSLYVWQQKMVIIISNNFNYHLCVETKNKKPQHIAETVFQSYFLQYKRNFNKLKTMWCLSRLWSSANYTALFLLKLSLILVKCSNTSFYTAMFCLCKSGVRLYQCWFDNRSMSLVSALNTGSKDPFLAWYDLTQYQLCTSTCLAPVLYWFHISMRIRSWYENFMK